MLLAEGKRREAETLVDSWKTSARFSLKQADRDGISPRSVVGCSANLAGGAATLYGKLGAEKKKAQALSVHRTAEQLYDQFEAKEAVNSNIYDLYAPKWSVNISSRDTTLSKESLTPQRMHEHLLIEDLMVMAVITLLMLFIVILWLQGDYWRVRLREAENPPRALIPGWREGARILLLGVVLPLAVYYIYSRLPFIGGRDFGWGSGQRPRFLIELIVTGAAMILLTAFFTRRWVRQKCVEEGIETPNPWSEAWVVWMVRILIVVVILFFRDAFDVLAMTPFGLDFFFGKMWTYAETYTFIVALALFGGFWLLMRKIWLSEKFGSKLRRGVMIAFICIVTSMVSLLIMALLDIYDIHIDFEFNFALFAVVVSTFFAAMMLFKRTPYGRYYGTLARSLAPVYACAILLLAVIVLPAVRGREAYWLRRDPFIYGVFSDNGGRQPYVEKDEAVIRLMGEIRAGVE